jgi:hypothetical protein
MARDTRATFWLVFGLRATAAVGCAPFGGGEHEVNRASTWASEESLLLDEDNADADTFGKTCQDDQGCGKKMMCTDAGQCACAPGLVACGKRCVNLALDARHCGTCGTKCGPSKSCIAGICGGGMEKDPPFEIDGADAPHTCTAANEGYPEASLTAPPGPGAQVFIEYQHKLGSQGSTNWAFTPTNWNSSYYDVPSTGVPGGDSWATSSGYTQLEYVSNIFTDAGGNCVGVAATSASTMQLGPSYWQYPMTCATAQTSGLQDGPAITYDEGGMSFWIVDTEGAPAAAVLKIFPNCTGRPGDPSTCLQQYTKTVDAAVLHHATVTVNPCTHNAIVAYRTTAGKVQLKFYSTAGGVGRTTFVVDGSAPFAANAGCPSGTIAACGTTQECFIPDLGGGWPDCARLASKVHVATKQSAGVCYAYVAYDSSYTSSSDAKTYMRANFAIVNVTNEQSPSLVIPTMRYPTSTSAQYNAFGSVSTASYYTDSVGWFYYKQGSTSGVNDPCNTYYQGQTNNSLGTSGTWTDQFLDSHIKTLRLNGADYVGIVRRGLPGGYFFPTWHRAVGTTASGDGCATCLGASHTLAIYASRIIP